VRSARRLTTAGLAAAAGVVALGATPAGAAPGASAQAAPSGVRLVPAGRFHQPVMVASPAGDRRRIFVVEREGRILIRRGNRTVGRPFLDVSRLISTDGERGLLSMAFAPDYARSGRFYLYLTDKGGDVRIVEYRRSRGSADRADPRSRRFVLRQEHSKFSNHNGGHLAFGPDRLLYGSIGDGGGGGDPLGSGQRLGTLLGKMIRIDPRRSGRRSYTVPRDNPFVGRRDARREIYAYGLRNPFRFSFDRQSGDLAIGDVGQGAVEEVDVVRRGRPTGPNFGWSVFEGNRRFKDGDAPGHVPPVLERLHENGVCSITGGLVVRDRGLPALFGRYVYGDFCAPELRSVRLETPQAVDDRPVGINVPQASGFGEDGTGRVYVTSLEGPVYRLAP